MLFAYNSQQWFNTDCIETIDDYGYDVSVKLKSGRECRVHGSDRELFFHCIADMRELPAAAAAHIIKHVFSDEKFSADPTSGQN